MDESPTRAPGLCEMQVVAAAEKRRESPEATQNKVMSFNIFEHFAPPQTHSEDEVRRCALGALLATRGAQT